MKNEKDDATAIRAREIAEKREQIPKSMRRAFDRAVSGKASPREVIKVGCMECIAWGNRKLISECDDYACSRWYYRPYVKHPKP